jgi:rhodanese-related sulfurtransferase
MFTGPMVVAEGGRAALYEQFAQVGKALAHPKRLEILEWLAQGERTVESLAQVTSLGLSTCSAQLQTLKHSRLVATRREGSRIFYRLAGPDVAHLCAAVQATATAHRADVAEARVAYLGPPDTEEIGSPELLRRARAGEVTVLDVRPATEFAAGHVPGALGIPLDELEARLAELPVDREIVAYCRGHYCVLSHEAVRFLSAKGFRARRLIDGMLEWRGHGLPVDDQQPSIPRDDDRRSTPA